MYDEYFNYQLFFQKNPNIGAVFFNNVQFFWKKNKFFILLLFQHIIPVFIKLKKYEKLLHI